MPSLLTVLIMATVRRLPCGVIQPLTRELKGSTIGLGCEHVRS